MLSPPVGQTVAGRSLARRAKGEGKVHLRPFAVLTCPSVTFQIA